MQGEYGDELSPLLLKELETPNLDSERVAMACRLQSSRLQLDKLSLEKELQKDHAQLRTMTWQYMRTNGFIGLRGLLGDLLILGNDSHYSSFLLIFGLSHVWISRGYSYLASQRFPILT